MDLHTLWANMLRESCPLCTLVGRSYPMPLPMLCHFIGLAELMLLWIILLLLLLLKEITRDQHCINKKFMLLLEYKSHLSDLANVFIFCIQQHLFEQFFSDIFFTATKLPLWGSNINHIEWWIQLLNVMGGFYIVGAGWIFISSFKF